MKKRLNRLRACLIYLNIVLTVIACPLAALFGTRLGFLSEENVQATTVRPLQIEVVREPIPPEIKRPVEACSIGVSVSRLVHCGTMLRGYEQASRHDPQEPRHASPIPVDHGD